MATNHPVERGLVRAASDGPSKTKPSSYATAGATLAASSPVSQVLRRRRKTSHEPTPQEILATIFEQVELDQINQEIDAMTDEQISKELEAEGYTQAKIDAAFSKQQEMLDELLDDEKRQRRRTALAFAAGVATTAVAAAVVHATTPSSPEILTASAAARRRHRLRKRFATRHSRRVVEVTGTSACAS